MTLVWLNFPEGFEPRAQSVVLESCNAALGAHSCAPVGEASAPLADADVAVGTGFRPGVDRYGFFLAGNYYPGSTGFLVGFSLRHQFRAVEPAARWESVAIGPGWSWLVAPVRFALHAQALAESLTVTATEPGQKQSASRFRWGGRGTASVSLELNRSLRLVAGLDLDYAAPTVTLGVAGVDKGAERGLQTQGFLGLGWCFR